MWIVVSLVFLTLSILLGYARPRGDVWLAGSIVLFVAWAFVFMRLVTAESGSKAK